MRKLYRFFSLSLCFAMLLSVTAAYAHAANNASFSDVPATHWANRYVESCASRGIVSGVGSGKFDPDGNVTYAQFAVMVSKLLFPEKAASASGSPWYAPYSQILREAGLWSGTELLNSDARAEQLMTRADMAQVSSNILQTSKDDFQTPNESEIRQQISDWNAISEYRRFAVASCYQYKILSGYADGRFGGGDTMTRAQACVVLLNLEETINGGSITPAPVTPDTPDTPVTPEKPSADTKDIEITTNVTQWGTGYYVADNGFETGYLNNGKPITEENVLELLAEAEKIWPIDMSWTYSGTKNNHWYQESGIFADYAILFQGKSSSNYGCGGFAAMISDYLFGKDNNPARLVTDHWKIRPGDIICAMNPDGTSIHVMIAASSTYTEGREAGRVDVADGNSNHKVNWPHQYSGPTSEEIFQMSNPGSYWVVYTRYPD